MRYRGFGKSPKKCNLMNRNNLSRSKFQRDFWVAQHEFLASPDKDNQRKMKELYKKIDKHIRLHGDGKKKRR